VAIRDFTRECEAIQCKHHDLFAKYIALQESLHKMEENQKKLEASDVSLQSLSSQMRDLKEEMSSESAKTLNVCNEREANYQRKFQHFEDLTSRSGKEMAKVMENLKNIQKKYDELSSQIQNVQKDFCEAESSENRKRKEREISVTSVPSKRSRVTVSDSSEMSSTSLHPRNHPILSTLHPKTPRELLIHYTLLTWNCDESDVSFPLEVDHLNFEYHVRQLNKKRISRK